MTPDVTAGEYAVGMTYTDRREAMMRHAALIGAFLLMAMTGRKAALDDLSGEGITILRQRD